MRRQFILEDTYDFSSNKDIARTLCICLCINLAIWTEYNIRDTCVHSIMLSFNYTGLAGGNNIIAPRLYSTYMPKHPDIFVPWKSLYTCLYIITVIPI